MLNHRQKISLTVLVALVTSSLSAATVFAAPKVAGKFQPILAELQKKTDVPIMIPSQLPTEVYAIMPEGSEPTNPNPSVPTFFPHIAEAKPSRYYISLDAAAECSGSNACSLGKVIGEKITNNTPDIPQEFVEYRELYRNDPNNQKPPVRRSPEKPAQVQLAGGITGYFVPFVCGASCSNSEVYWDQGGYRYVVGLENSNRQTVVNLANSAIRNQK
ncbi:MAG: hypothetical protein GVY04_05000 [Cyanobacteria bacterium]|jgi:hypothetical protein|nr:hypothetical protein [Cyanobacteria bacterium GSL.Bin1]